VSEPLLQSAIWNHYRYWFDIIGDRLSEQLGDALSRFLDWRPVERDKDTATVVRAYVLEADTVLKDLTSQIRCTSQCPVSALSGYDRSGDGGERATITKRKRGAQGGQEALKVSLGDAVLTAVQAHGEGAPANEILSYLSREFGMTVKPNHLGIALQRHRRTGRLENRDQRWYLTSSAPNEQSEQSA
jgi:hypothetical protein